MIIYLGVEDIAEWFGVKQNTVTAWSRRYKDSPQPDAMIRTRRGWLPERKNEWLVWYVARGLRTGRK